MYIYIYMYSIFCGQNSMQGLYNGPFERPGMGSVSFWIARNIDPSSSALLASPVPF